MKLAILIPCLVETRHLTERLIKELSRQINEIGTDQVVLLKHEDNREKTTGRKRNELVQKAVELNASHIAHHDSDDLPGPTYVRRYLECVEGDFDCAELWGNYYVRGKLIKPFHHSTIYSEWFEMPEHYCRSINHLNCQRLSIAKQFPFPDQVFGEDGVNSLAMIGAFKTEMKIPEVIYNYYK